MRVSPLSLAFPVAGLAAAGAAALATFAHSDWNLPVIALLLAFALAGDILEVEARGLRVSGAFLAIGLAMVILGPAPAVIIALVTAAADCARRRPAFVYVLTNLAGFASFPLVGAAIARLQDDQGDLNYALITIVAFLAANAVNFVYVAVIQRLVTGKSFWRTTGDLFVPLLPSQLAVGVLAALIVYAYAHGGDVALVLLIGVVVLYQYLLRELLLSRDRAEALGARTHQLAALQVGVLTTMLQTLSLRDKMTARHCAAVARYAREIAREYGCGEDQQELVHTAALLHDIGKFIFPDRILLADRKLDAEDWEIVKKHPAQGAKVVRGVDGYGPVADIILAHHERIDGAGYPNGLAGDDIPLLSRMISVADTYDVMTARDSYREPVSPAEAIAELRRVSGTQLDGELVELFIKLLERRGIGFHHGDDADFESELDLERRIRTYAEPKAAA